MGLDSRFAIGRPNGRRGRRTSRGPRETLRKHSALHPYSYAHIRDTVEHSTVEHSRKNEVRRAHRSGNGDRGHFGAPPAAAVSGNLETSCEEFLMPTRKYRTYFGRRVELQRRESPRARFRRWRCIAEYPPRVRLFLDMPVLERHAPSRVSGVPMFDTRPVDWRIHPPRESSRTRAQNRCRSPNQSRAQGL